MTMHKDFKQQQRENKTDWWLIGLMVAMIVLFTLLFWLKLDQALAR